MTAATDRQTRSKSPESEVGSLTQEAPDNEVTQEATQGQYSGGYIEGYSGGYTGSTGSKPSFVSQLICYATVPYPHEKVKRCLIGEVSNPNTPLSCSFKLNGGGFKPNHTKLDLYFNIIKSTYKGYIFILFLKILSNNTLL